MKESLDFNVVIEKFVNRGPRKWAINVVIDGPSVLPGSGYIPSLFHLEWLFEVTLIFHCLFPISLPFPDCPCWGTNSFLSVSHLLFPFFFLMHPPFPCPQVFFHGFYFFFSSPLAPKPLLPLFCSLSFQPPLNVSVIAFYFFISFQGRERLGFNFLLFFPPSLSCLCFWLFEHTFFIRIRFVSGLFGKSPEGLYLRIFIFNAL